MLVAGGPCGFLFGAPTDSRLAPAAKLLFFYSRCKFYMETTHFCDAIINNIFRFSQPYSGFDSDSIQIFQQTKREILRVKLFMNTFFYVDAFIFFTNKKQSDP